MENNNILIPIEQMESRFRSVVRRLPTIAGNIAVNFALDNFKRQGFLADTFQPWRPRKDPTKWGQHPKRNSRAILVDAGRLRRSIRVIRTNLDEVVIGSDVPYAKVHNEGVRLGEIQQVGSFTRKINTVAKVSSVVTKKTKSQKVQIGETPVKAFTRRINQDIPARPFLKDSQYLRNQLSREVGAEILKALRP